MFEPIELNALNGAPIIVNFSQVMSIHQGFDTGQFYSCLIMSNGKIIRVLQTYDEIMGLFEWEEED